MGLYTLETSEPLVMFSNKELKYNEKTGEFEYVIPERTTPVKHPSRDISYSSLINNATIKSHIDEIRTFAREGKTFAARKYFVDEFGCTWDDAQYYLNKVISPTGNLYTPQSPASKAVSSSRQTESMTPRQFSINDSYIQSNKNNILQLYSENKTFAAKKYFVDAFGCTWSQAQVYLDKFLESCHISLNRLNFREYFPSYIEANKSRIISLYRSGKTFAARKYFVDVYGCTWDEASLKLEQFISKNC